MLKEILEEVLSVDEKHMTATAKMKAKKQANTPAARKARKKKADCESRNAKKLKNFGGKVVCKSDGKLGKGMSKADKKKRAKSRKKSGISGQ